MEDRMHITCPNEGVVVRRIDAERKMGVSVSGSLSIGPRRCFSVPYEVLDDPSLNHSEKRAILAEWASDACAVESFPALRRLSGTNFPVTLSSIMDAMAQLDEECDTQTMGSTSFTHIPTVNQVRSSGASARAPLCRDSFATA